MATLYARRTALSSVGGRISYVDRDARKYKSTQEDLLGKYDGAADLLHGRYWEYLSRESQAAWAMYGPEDKTRVSRTGKEIELKAREGQELVVKLPNSLLDRLHPDEIARKLGQTFEQHAGRPCHVAVHWNHDRTNLHAHIIYAERQLLQEPVERIAPRNLFYDEAGKRRYKQKEILDVNGNIRPGCNLIRKGEVYEIRAFGAVDQQLGTRGWLAEAKTKWLLPLLNGALRGDVEYQEFDYSTGRLPQQHAGDVAHVDTDTARATHDDIEGYNGLVREYNGLVDAGKIRRPEAMRIQAAVLQAPQRSAVLAQELDQVRDRLARRRRPLDGIKVPGIGDQTPAEPAREIQPAGEDLTPVQRGGQMRMSEWLAAGDAAKATDRAGEAAAQDRSVRPRSSGRDRG